jgi:hypothetical protein
MVSAGMIPALAEPRRTGSEKHKLEERAMRGFGMNTFRRLRAARTVAAAACLALLATAALPAQQPDEASVIRHIDAAAQARYENVLGFTVTESYAVYRGKDETPPVAQMTVKTTYRKGSGKSYAILSQSGSEIVQKFGLHPLLDNEKNINAPGNVEKSWFTSANFEMKLKPGVIQRLNGRDCIALSVVPRRKAPNMIDGTLWVDANDDSIVEIEGVASRSPSVFAGATHMMRRYTNMSGFAMAEHARAESSSMLWGRTVVIIDYSDYQLQLARPNEIAPVTAATPVAYRMRYTDFRDTALK